MISPILWQNASATVTLIDVPTSIIDAQRFDSHSRDLLSCEPAVSAFPSTEPKSAVARRKLESTDDDRRLHNQYQQLLRDAVEEIQKSHTGEWCLPRPFMNKRDSAGVLKRKLNEGVQQERSETSTSLSGDNNYYSHAIEPKDQYIDVHNRGLVYRLDDSPPPSCDDSLVHHHSFSGFLSNDHNTSATLTLCNIFSNNPLNPLRYHLPPKSTLSLTDCDASEDFHSSIQEQAEENQTRSKFDFILLDPPWPNRSVRRTHKTPGSSYRLSPTLEDVRRLLLGLQVEDLLDSQGQIGIWITNKPSIRASVLDEHDGLFARWGVRLVEEWIWLKTTTHGEPIMPLDGLWRRPYEVLLLGRRQDGDTMEKEKRDEVVRRVVVGVPDLHSRKPCLKALIERRMDDPDHYRALEVFARHLVAGWWSWGDECIKFNREECWRNRGTEERERLKKSFESLQKS